MEEVGVGARVVVEVVFGGKVEVTAGLGYCYG